MASESDRVALFIDVDNLFISAQGAGLPFNLGLVIDRVREEGTVMSAKAYADWANQRLRPVLPDFRQYAIEQVHLPTSGSRMSNEFKNTADIQLAVDAMEMVFSQVRPNTVVIAGGDRDFVPLVQKLKRYGARVLGMGVETSVSSVLAQACDAFVYYDGLVPPAPEEHEPISSAVDMQPTYVLMRRAAEALMREGRQTLGAAVLPMMKQLDPTFDLSRFRTTFKDLAAAAKKEGYVEIVERPGSDLVIAATDSAPTIQGPVAPSRDYDYSSETSALASYRTILQEQRIPLLPWQRRIEFLTYLWALKEQGPMSMDRMRYELVNYTESNAIEVSQQAILKFFYSLNFAKCFSKDGRYPAIIEVPGDVQEPVYLLGTHFEAANSINRRYLEILRRAGASLIPQPVGELLFENPAVRAEHQDETDRMCNDLQRPTAFGQALQSAQTRRLAPRY